MLTQQHITDWFLDLQDEICQNLEKLDGKAKFWEDKWERKGGGGGRTRIIQQGNVLEKGGVNFSAVHGQLSPKMCEQLELPQADSFYATGVSIVLHPYNPHLPIIHMNVRYFEMSNGIAWFGGGIDLTPHYIVPAEARFFHEQLKKACDKHTAYYYPKFKKWADNYFFIPHRQETRGVGGIFFDRLRADEEHDLSSRFAFVQSVGKAFVPIYRFFVEKNRDKPYTAEEKQWQMLRRSRYVEFNLVYDRGTKFGLKSHGRIESILMSLPPQAHWTYNFQAVPDSAEAETLNLLRKGIEWGL